MKIKISLEGLQEYLVELSKSAEGRKIVAQLEKDKVIEWVRK